MSDEAYLDESVDRLARWMRGNATTPRERALLLRRLYDGLARALLEDAPGTSHITAANAVVEVVDAASGYLFRRYLEVEYDESVNGLRLLGEDIAAKPVQIVFLSEEALGRMHELRGQGPDEPRCME